MGNVLYGFTQKENGDLEGVMSHLTAMKRRWPFSSGDVSQATCPLTLAEHIPSAASQATSSSESESSSASGDNVPMKEILPGYKIQDRYKVIQDLGSGTFGVVVQAFDIKMKKDVAIKVTKDSGVKLGGDGENEASILKILNEGDKKDEFHIVKLLEDFAWHERHFLVFELLPMSLKAYLVQWRLADHILKGLPVDQTIYISYQLLEALHYLHRRKIMHCDLKPDNIMIKNLNTLEIKVIDFGAFEVQGTVSGSHLYMQTRHYRSPDVILGMRYDCSMDMWSFGCIVAEMHIGDTLIAGDNEPDQLFRMLEVFGLPPPDSLRHATKMELYFTKTEVEDDWPEYTPLPAFRNKYHPPGSIRFSDIFNRGNGFKSDKKTMEKEKLLLQFIKKVLTTDPFRRPSASAVLYEKVFKRINEKKFKFKWPNY